MFERCGVFFFYRGSRMFESLLETSTLKTRHGGAISQLTHKVRPLSSVLIV